MFLLAKFFITLYPFTGNTCNSHGMDTQRIGTGVVCVNSDGVLYSINSLAEMMDDEWLFL